MNTSWKPLALAALILASGCSSVRFEPTANWWRDGGRLCMASPEPLAWDRAAPRPCAQAHLEKPAPGSG